MRKILIVVLLVLLSGCRALLYVCIGPQKSKKVEITVEGQAADPNIPEGLINVGLLP